MQFYYLNFLNFFFFLIFFLNFFFLFITFSIYFCSNFFNKNIFILNKLFLNLNNLKNLIIKSIFLLFILIFFFFLIYINYLLSYSNIFYLNKKYLNNLINNLYFNFFIFTFKINIYGIIILLLSYFVGFIAISTLNTININQKVKLNFFFLQFSIIILFFISFNNLLLIFFFYELLLILSFLIVFYSSYSKKSIQASIYFVIWTQIGSILVLLSICLIYKLTNTTNLYVIKSFHFKYFEVYYIYILFFFGFGFKVPIWPFHYWLTKTHVEAPSGFSIYLSGFLVKTAIFAFYKITNYLYIEINTFFFFCILIIGSIDASLKMWGQSDLKKLIAYGTIQEMNLIMIFFLNGDSSFNSFGILFNITHTFLSILMFFLIECIYSRYKSRSIFFVRGIIHYCNNLSFSIILMIIFFSGLPGTLKFICELQLFNICLKYSWFFTFFFIICLNVLGLVGFSKNWFNAVFTTPNIKQKKILDLNKKEIYIISLCFFILFFFVHLTFWIF